MTDKDLYWVTFMSGVCVGIGVVLLGFPLFERFPMLPWLLAPGGLWILYRMIHLAREGRS